MELAPGASLASMRGGERATGKGCGAWRTCQKAQAAPGPSSSATTAASSAKRCSAGATHAQQSTHSTLCVLWSLPRKHRQPNLHPVA